MEEKDNGHPGQEGGRQSYAPPPFYCAGDGPDVHWLLDLQGCGPLFFHHSLFEMEDAQWIVASSLPSDFADVPFSTEARTAVVLTRSPALEAWISYLELLGADIAFVVDPDGSVSKGGGVR